MKRLVGAMLIVFIAVILYRPASGQDTLETRVASLETQVADLRTQVAAAGATPPAPANPPPVIVGAEYVITGTILLHGNDETVAPEGATGCTGGRGRFDGLTVGAVLPITTLDGKVIGEATITGTRIGSWGAGAPACALDFRTGFLGQTDAYAIQVSPSDELVLTFEELADSGWRIERTIEV